MSNTRATKRYFQILVPAVVAFLAASFAIDWLDDRALIAPSAIYAFAVIPIAALLLVFWAHLRFIAEVDEYLRSIQIRAVIFGLVIILTVATGWGYLEAYAGAADFGVFWLNPIFWVAYGAATAFLTWRETGSFE